MNAEQKMKGESNEPKNFQALKMPDFSKIHQHESQKPRKELTSTVSKSFELQSDKRSL